MYGKISYYSRRSFWTLGGVTLRLFGDPLSRCSEVYKNVDSLNAVLDRPLKVHIDALTRKQEREVRLVILQINGDVDSVDYVSKPEADCVIRLSENWHTVIESRISGYTNTWDIGRLPFSVWVDGKPVDEFHGVDVFSSEETSVSDRPSTNRTVEKIREAARNSEHPLDEFAEDGGFDSPTVDEVLENNRSVEELAGSDSRNEGDSE